MALFSGLPQTNLRGPHNKTTQGGRSKRDAQITIFPQRGGVNFRRTQFFHNQVLSHQTADASLLQRLPSFLAGAQSTNTRGAEVLGGTIYWRAHPSFGQHHELYPEGQHNNIRFLNQGHPTTFFGGHIYLLSGALHISNHIVVLGNHTRGVSSMGYTHKGCGRLHVGGNIPRFNHSLYAITSEPSSKELRHTFLGADIFRNR